MRAPPGNTAWRMAAIKRGGAVTPAARWSWASSACWMRDIMTGLLAGVRDVIWM
jgi:hypothetical protein